MTTTALSCGNFNSTMRPSSDAVQWHDLPATPGRAEVDPLLARAGDRIVVRGTDADLAAVVVRMLRKGLLRELAVGYVPVADSPAARLWGLRVEDLDRALHAPGAPTPLLKDDTGGVLVGEGVVAPITGQVYCDDARVLHGTALRLVVTPDPEAAALPEPTEDPIGENIAPIMDGVRVFAARRGLLRRRTSSARGRAVQLAFEETTVRHDGVDHPRPISKWVWHRHTEDLLLAR
ncbi:hypothetical protein [Salinifilum ghardaiensis]